MDDVDLITAIATGLGRSAPPIDSVEYAQWIQWISDAKVQIRQRLGVLEALDQDTLAYVVREAVIGKVKYPDATSRRDVEVDDGRTSITFERATGQVSIWDAWWDMLTPRGQTVGASSTRPTFQPDCPPMDRW